MVFVDEANKTSINIRSCGRYKKYLVAEVVVAAVADEVVLKPWDLTVHPIPTQLYELVSW